MKDSKMTEKVSKPRKFHLKTFGDMATKLNNHRDEIAEAFTSGGAIDKMIAEVAIDEIEKAHTFFRELKKQAKLLV